MAATKMEDDYKALRSEMEVLRADLAKVTAALGKLAEGGLDAASEKLSAAAVEGRARFKQGAEAVEQQIEDHPFASVAIAFCAGLLVGRVLSD